MKRVVCSGRGFNDIDIQFVTGTTNKFALVSAICPHIGSVMAVALGGWERQQRWIRGWECQQRRIRWRECQQQRRVGGFSGGLPRWVG